MRLSRQTKITVLSVLCVFTTLVALTHGKAAAQQERVKRDDGKPDFIPQEEWDELVNKYKHAVVKGEFTRPTKTSGATNGAAIPNPDATQPARAHPTPYARRLNPLQAKPKYRKTNQFYDRYDRLAKAKIRDGASNALPGSGKKSDYGKTKSAYRSTDGKHSCDTDHQTKEDRWVPNCTKNTTGSFVTPQGSYVASFEACQAKCCKNGNVLNWAAATRFCICQNCEPNFDLVPVSMAYELHIFPQLLHCPHIHNVFRLDDCSDIRGSICKFQCKEGFRLEKGNGESACKLLEHPSNNKTHKSMMMMWDPLPHCIPGTPRKERDLGQEGAESKDWIAAPVFGTLLLVSILTVVGVMEYRKRKGFGRKKLQEEKEQDEEPKVHDTNVDVCDITIADVQVVN